MLGAVLPAEERDATLTALFTRFASTASVLGAPTAALEGTPGVNRAGIARFRALRALAGRLGGARLETRPPVRSRAQRIRVASIALGQLATEAFCTIHVDEGPRVICCDVIRCGTVSRAPSIRGKSLIRGRSSPAPSRSARPGRSSSTTTRRATRPHPSWTWSPPKVSRSPGRCSGCACTTTSSSPVGGTSRSPISALCEAHW